MMRKGMLRQFGDLVRSAYVLAGRIPDARLRIYPGAKHMFFVECAEQFNADVVAFLQEPSAAK